MNEKEIETMMRSAKKRQPKEHEISLLDTFPTIDDFILFMKKYINLNQVEYS